VNVRLSRSSGVGPEELERLRPALEASARFVGATPVPIPISFNVRAAAPSAAAAVTEGPLADLTDSQSIRELLSGFDGVHDGGESIRTVGDVIEQVGRCRVVVTGAYHAAVFALAQGISAICLAGSDYFATKMLGLADQFGRGCDVISLRDQGLGAAVFDAVRRAWKEADLVRPALLDAARRQVVCSRDAYRGFVGAAAARHVERRPGPGGAGSRR
jgi:colanic acid/amylovoran biosynthesis protein